MKIRTNNQTAKFAIMILLLLTIFSCCPKRQQQIKHSGPLVKCEFMKAADTYFEDTVRYKRYMIYLRRIHLFAYLYNAGDEKAYVPLKCKLEEKDSVRGSEINVFIGKKKMSSYLRRCKGLYGYVLYPNDTAIVKITITGKDLEEFGLSKFTSPEKIMSNIRFEYKKDYSDTLYYKNKISDIYFKINEKFFYEYRDTTHPDKDVLWIL